MKQLFFFLFLTVSTQLLAQIEKKNTVSALASIEILSLSDNNEEPAAFFLAYERVFYTKNWVHLRAFADAGIFKKKIRRSDTRADFDVKSLGLGSTLSVGKGSLKGDFGLIFQTDFVSQNVSITGETGIPDGFTRFSPNFLAGLRFEKNALMLRAGLIGHNSYAPRSFAFKGGDMVGRFFVNAGFNF